MARFTGADYGEEVRLSTNRLLRISTPTVSSTARSLSNKEFEPSQPCVPPQYGQIVSA
jgi:hypothetical protein